MRVLLSAPCVYPLGGSGYGGMERLCVLVAAGLRARGHEVTVVGGNGSDGEGVYAGSASGDYLESEEVAWREYSWLLGKSEVVLDFSHSHFWRTEQGRVPGLSLIWHDPRMMRPRMPTSNVCALSAWQARRFTEETGQVCGELDVICGDEAVYYHDGSVVRGERWLAIGVMQPQKGNLEAARLARKLGVGLDIIGPHGDAAYEQAVLSECSPPQVVYHGEVSHPDKMRLLRECVGLIYPVSYPPGMGEAHSHKLVEALMCGTQGVILDQGAMKEVFQGHAWLASDGEEMGRLMGMVATKDEERRSNRAYDTARRSKEVWGVGAAALRVEKALERVISGERW